MITDQNRATDSRVETTQVLSPLTSPRRKEGLANDERKPRVVILAGGDGMRSLVVTRALTGDDRPKQFTALVGHEPLLVQTERRAVLLAPADRTHIVLTRKHEPWYREILPADGAFRLLVQPENRGTGTAVLLALLRISAETTHAPVVILPSDHWVSSDSAFMLYAQAAVEFVQEHPSAVVLLGVAPTRPETEYGWIEAGAPILDAAGGMSRVNRFVEKPPANIATDLYASGTSFWNTSVVVGSVDELLMRFALARPELVDAFLEIWASLGSPWEQGALERLYPKLPGADLSRHILSGSAGALSVIPIRGVAWEDLGHLRGIHEAIRLHADLASGEPKRLGIRRPVAEPGTPRHRPSGSPP